MKYDIEKVTRLLGEMKAAHALLKELAEMDLESFRSDPHRVASAKYNLLVAIEATIDICNHIISKNDLKVPEDSADTFNIMADNDLIPVSFSKTLIKMTRLRYRLVNLDIEILYSILKNNLDDFNAFTKILNKILK